MEFKTRDCICSFYGPPQLHPDLSLGNDLRDLLKDQTALCFDEMVFGAGKFTVLRFRLTDQQYAAIDLSGTSDLCFAPTNLPLTSPGQAVRASEAHIHHLPPVTLCIGDFHVLNDYATALLMSRLIVASRQDVGMPLFGGCIGVSSIGRGQNRFDFPHARQTQSGIFADRMAKLDNLRCSILQHAMRAVM